MIIISRGAMRKDKSWLNPAFVEDRLNCWRDENSHERKRRRENRIYGKCLRALVPRKTVSYCSLLVFDVMILRWRRRCCFHDVLTRLFWYRPWYLRFPHTLIVRRFPRELFRDPIIKEQIHFSLNLSRSRADPCRCRTRSIGH